MATSYLDLARSIAQQTTERHRSEPDFVYEENEVNEVIPLSDYPTTYPAATGVPTGPECAPGEIEAVWIKTKLPDSYRRKRSKDHYLVRQAWRCRYPSGNYGVTLWTYELAAQALQRWYDQHPEYTRSDDEHEANTNESEASAGDRSASR
jgi:hypothetical protein